MNRIARDRCYWLTIILLFTVFSILPASAASAENEYYVSLEGDDQNPGTIDAPWQSIRHAVDIAGPGDAIYLRGGTYYEHIRIESSGNSEGYITISAYNAEVPVIDGTGVTEGQNGIVITGSYISLEGIEVMNWEENGIWTEGAGYLEIADCSVHDVGYGVGVSAGTHDFTLNRVEMYNFEYYGFDASPSGGGDCFNGILNDCIAHSCRYPEYGHEVDGFALSHEGDQHNFVLNRCQAYNVGDGFVFGGKDVVANRCSAHDSEVGFKIWGDAISLVNCVSYRNSASNLELDWDEEPGTTTVMNCNFIDSGDYNIWVENSGNRLEMYNSIVAGSNYLGLIFEERDASNYRGDYNIFHGTGDALITVGYEDEFTSEQIGTGAWTTYSGQDSHSLVVDSLESIFLETGANNFNLPEGSSAIDRGLSAGAPADDYRGYSRSEIVDIGAFEYGGVPVTDRTPAYTWTSHDEDTEVPETESPLSVLLTITAIMIGLVLILTKKIT
jgi:hypothetical protein